MQIQPGFEEIAAFLLCWGLAAVVAEALIEILLTAGPLEPIRAFLARRSSFIAQLISCGYCFSVWFCMFVAWVLPSPIELINGFGIGNDYLLFIDDHLWWFVNGILLHRLSNVVHIKVTNAPPDFEVADE